MIRNSHAQLLTQILWQWIWIRACWLCGCGLRIQSNQSEINNGLHLHLLPGTYIMAITETTDRYIVNHGSNIYGPIRHNLQAPLPHILPHRIGYFANPTNDRIYGQPSGVLFSRNHCLQWAIYDVTIFQSSFMPFPSRMRFPNLLIPPLINHAKLNLPVFSTYSSISFASFRLPKRISILIFLKSADNVRDSRESFGTANEEKVCYDGLGISSSENDYEVTGQRRLLTPGSPWIHSIQCFSSSSSSHRCQSWNSLMSQTHWSLCRGLLQNWSSMDQ